MNRCIKYVSVLIMMMAFAATAAAADPVITVIEPTSDPSSNFGETVTFNITVNQTVDIKWYIDEILIRSDSNVAAETYNTYENSSACLLYTSPSPRDRQKSRMPSSA